MNNPFEIIEHRLQSVEKLLIQILLEIEDLNKKEKEKLISGKEACELFSPKISLPTLKRWNIPSYTIGCRVWYKKSEIMQSVKSIKKFNPE